LFPKGVDVCCRPRGVAEHRRRQGAVDSIDEREAPIVSTYFTTTRSRSNAGENHRRSRSHGDLPAATPHVAIRRPALLRASRLGHNLAAKGREEANMQCVTCGQAVAEGASVCGHCGATVTGGGAATAGSGLVERVKAILLTPRTTWPVVAAERTTPRDIYVRYVAPLAAIGVIASFIGTVLVGISVPLLGTIRVGFFAGVATAILHFLLTFAAVFIVAWIVDALAPTFGGQKDPLAALKVAAYSLTPAWVAGILTILPSLSFVAALLGLYGLYLLYLGLPVLMRAPADRALGYTVVVVICAIVVNIVISAVIGFASGGLVTQHM
jgi:hypothetical protein